MYACNNCGYVFETPIEVSETHGFKDGMAEKWLTCPSCGESDYDDAAYCDECGASYAEGDYDIPGWCPTCSKLMRKGWEAYKSGLSIHRLNALRYIISKEVENGEYNL